MIPLSSAIPGGLAWSKTPHNRGYELRSNGGTVGSLQRKSCWSSESRADSADGSWKFRRTGWFHTLTEITDPISGTRTALFRPNWTGGGLLEFSNGLRFRLTHKGLWRPIWTLLTDSGQPVLSIRQCDKTVQIWRESPVTKANLILLTIFTWHIIRQTAEDAASTAVAVAVVS